MFAVVAITPWHWAGFILAVLLFVALDLFVFHRQARTISFKEAMVWTGICVVLALLFGLALVPMRGRQEAMEFITGYIIELSLSMDNVFVIALIFAFFRVPTAYQHRVLFFGFIDALIMRGTIIYLGTALVARFHFILYVLGILLIYSGFKMMVSKEEGVHPEKNPFIKLAQKWFPVSTHFEGARFLTRVNGRRALTPLMLVLLMVESADLMFAVDSIPAIFAVTTKPFIVFTSNIFAILGLRSLFFVLVGMMEYFRYLKYGLALVLVFIGGKMLAGIFQMELSTVVSLAVVAALLAISVLASLILVQRQPHADADGKPAEHPEPADAGKRQ